MIGNLIPFIIMFATGVAALWRDAPYPAVLFLLMTAAWVLVRILLTQGEDKPVASETDRGRERKLTTGVSFGMMILPALTLAFPFLDFAAYQAAPLQPVLGVGVGALGTYVFWRSHADLGKNWSPHLEVREDHTLVTEGIYRRIRHPMYTAIFLITLAQLLILNNWIAGPAGFASFLLLYALRINAEEAMMQDQFGEAWDSYAQATPRLLPKLF